MSNNKQSSVEWFWLNLNDDLIGDLPPEKILKIYELVQQAKAMHKEEMIDAWMDGDARIPEEMSRKEAEYYYNSTFGGNNEQQ